MQQPDTYTCAYCLLPVAKAAQEAHEHRHADFLDYGKRRNKWTPADKAWLAKGGIRLEEEAA